MNGQETPISSADSHEELLVRVNSPDTLNIYSLVLSAAAITHRINIVSLNHLEIYVQSALGEMARRELRAYTDENESRSAQPENKLISPPAFQAMSTCIIGCLVGLYGLTGDWRPESLWFAKGAGNSEAILNHSEFYRLVTALTLHADSLHLLSNCVFGLFLLHFFFQYTGNGIGLVTLLFTSVIANYLNVMLHGPGHMFVGFSTTVFSVIGMLCTMSFALKTPRRALGIFMAVMAGLALLALLGSEGERTDLGSHLFGLLSGLICGNFVLLPFFPSLRATFWLQTLLAALSLSIFYGCWLLALSR